MTSLKKLAVIGAVCMMAAQALPVNEQVRTLDGYGDLKRFQMFSGYVSLPETEKQIHYIATLAQANWTTAPVIFWFNGGPGCSSMLGLMQEHGPYIIPEGKKDF